jgi:hypothetical protein
LPDPTPIRWQVKEQAVDLENRVRAYLLERGWKLAKPWNTWGWAPPAADENTEPRRKFRRLGQALEEQLREDMTSETTPRCEGEGLDG